MVVTSRISSHVFSLWIHNCRLIYLPNTAGRFTISFRHMQLMYLVLPDSIQTQGDVLLGRKSVCAQKYGPIFEYRGHLKGGRWRCRCKKCLRPHYMALRTISGRKCTRLQDFAHTMSNVFLCDSPAAGGCDPFLAHPSIGGRGGASAPVLESRHQFPIGSPVFPFLLFYKTTTVMDWIKRRLQLGWW